MESDSEDAVVVPRGVRRVAGGAARVDSDDEEMMAVPVARADSGEEGGDADADAAPRPAMQRLKRLQTAGAAAAAAEAVRLLFVSLFGGARAGLTRYRRLRPATRARPPRRATRAQTPALMPVLKPALRARTRASTRRARTKRRLWSATWPRRAR